jgi:asparagine synthase (glutamine-hydrolysing)
MSTYLGSDHSEVMVTRADIARVFPEVILHTETPILRTAPAPLFLLSESVRAAGIKVVLTGEGADEMFAGYDLFREAKIRRFWARQADSKLRPRLLDRLYPYLARSPVSHLAMAREFFGRNLSRSAAPGFSHEVRWQTTSSLKRLFSPQIREAIDGRDSAAELFALLPPDFSRWAPLAQDQYLEIRTLLTGYILSSQGDRMLMAHSVEGRFPFLDAEVAELANSLPASHKLRVLDEKHVLKRAAKGLVPEAIAQRPKQPYRAPDALAFAGPDAPDWAAELMSARVVGEAGVFDARLVERLWRKCREGGAAPFSNADNMALCGVLSTQLLHAELVRGAPRKTPGAEYRTFIDRCARLAA